jgi:DNA-binding NarL/FixJ family response regulator
MPKILIADDHAVVREGLKKILADAIPNLVFGEAETGEQALALCERDHWDVVLLDMTLPVVSGLDVLKRLKALGKKTRVLVVSMHPEFAYAKRVLQLGAMGYLNKGSVPQELVRAVRRILSGGRYISGTLAEKLASDLNPDHGRPPHENLSHREYQVMCMIASGRKPTDAASELALSPKTISTYRARILEKMELQDNTELVAYCLLHDLVGKTPT